MENPSPKISISNKIDALRLALAKEAILMFFSKLRKNDAFGLVVFNQSAKTLIPLQTVAGI